MSQAYCSGPVHLFVGVSPGDGDKTLVNGGGRDITKCQPIYLGTFQDAPKILTTPQWTPIDNQLWGNSFDMSYQGVYGDIFGELTVFNWSVLRLCQTRPNVALTEGSDNILAIGTMMVTEGYAYPLWLQYPYYQTKQVFAGNAVGSNAPPGYRYYAAWLLGPEEEDLGTKSNKVFVHFRCYRKQGSYTGGGGVDTTNQFILRDTNMNQLISIERGIGIPTTSMDGFMGPNVVIPTVINPGGTAP